MRVLKPEEIQAIALLHDCPITEREAIALDQRSPVALGAPLPLIHQVLSCPIC